MSYEEIVLLCSRSLRSQQNLKISVNNWPDDIFWIAEPFTTKLSVVMHPCEPEYQAHSQGVGVRGGGILSCKATDLVGLVGCFTSRSLFDRPKLTFVCPLMSISGHLFHNAVIMPHPPPTPRHKGVYFCLCVWSCPYHIFWTAERFFFFFYQTWYSGVLSCGVVHYLQCQSHCKGLYNQNMTVPSVWSKLLVHLQASLVW